MSSGVLLNHISAPLTLILKSLLDSIDFSWVGLFLIIPSHWGRSHKQSAWIYGSSFQAAFVLYEAARTVFHSSQGSPLFMDIMV